MKKTLLGSILILSLLTPSVSSAMTSEQINSSLTAIANILNIVKSLTAEVISSSFTVDTEDTTERELTQFAVNSSLISHYTFDEGDSKYLEDSTGNNDGSIVGAIPVNGKFNQALEFDGVKSYVDIGNFDVLGSEITLSAWIKADQFDHLSYRDARIISKADFSTSNQEHYWMLSTVKDGSDTKLRFRLKTDGNTDTLISKYEKLRTDTWTHVVATYDGGSMRIYQDGELVGHKSKTGNISQDPNVPVWIGDNPGGKRTFDGVIDDVRVYSESLSRREVEELYTNTTPTLTFTDPLGGETYVEGEVINITWDSNQVGAVTLFIVNGGTATAFVNDIPNTGSYGWVVKRNLINDNPYRIRAYAYDDIRGSILFTAESSQFAIVASSTDTVSYDVNQDGSINISDLHQIQNSVDNVRYDSEYYDIYTDLDQDGVNTSADFFIMRNYLAAQGDTIAQWDTNFNGEVNIEDLHQVSGSLDNLQYNNEYYDIYTDLDQDGVNTSADFFIMRNYLAAQGDTIAQWDTNFNGEVNIEDLHQVSGSLDNLQYNNEYYDIYTDLDQDGVNTSADFFIMRNYLAAQGDTIAQWDTNFNGEVNREDLAFVERLIRDFDNYSPYADYSYDYFADINQDGTNDYDDFFLLRNYLADNGDLEAKYEVNGYGDVDREDLEKIAEVIDTYARYYSADNIESYSLFADLDQDGVNDNGDFYMLRNYLADNGDPGVEYYVYEFGYADGGGLGIIESIISKQPTTTATGWILYLDINQDGDITNKDFFILRNYLTAQGDVLAQYDVNQDGIVDREDLGEVAHRVTNNLNYEQSYYDIYADIDQDSTNNPNDFFLLRNYLADNVDPDIRYDVNRLDGVDHNDLEILEALIPFYSYGSSTSTIADAILYLDINQDGDISILDYNLLDQYLNGSIEEPPVIKYKYPRGKNIVLAEDAASTFIAVITDTPAICRYSVTKDNPYSDMNKFSYTGDLTHTETLILSGFPKNQEIRIYVKCAGTYNNLEMNGYKTIKFSIGELI